MKGFLRVLVFPVVLLFPLFILWEHTFRQELTIAYDVDNCRNFPQGEVSDMISDISTGIGYVIQNIESYGGDPNM